MKKTYIVIKGQDSYTFQTGDVHQECIAPQADIRYPSKYKQLVSYTLNWQTRNIMEASAQPTLFVTFTYNDDHYLENRLLNDSIKDTLRDDWQRYTKRLRRSLQYHGYDIPFKYYTISERGDDGRLHFHSLLYGFEHSTFKSRNKKGQLVDLVEFSPITDIIEKSWGQGFVFFESACPENIKYVTKYIHKRKISPDYISLKSNGIGLSYLTENRVKHFQDAECTEFHINGHTYFMPRYIKKKIYSEEQVKRINLKLAEKQFLKDFDKVKKLWSLNDNRHYAYWNKCADDVKHLLQTGPLCPTENDIIEGLKHLGITYDSYTDEMTLCYEETDAVRFERFRQRYKDNLRMKSVFNKRL